MNGFRWAFWSSALSYKFKLFFFFAFLFSLFMLCEIIFIFLSNISLHLYQSYVYKFSLMMIEICVIWSSLQLSYHISLTISSAAVKCCHRNLPLTTMLRCPASLIEIQGSGTLGVEVLLLYVYLYIFPLKGLCYFNKFKST